jgi:hypothetical protein
MFYCLFFMTENTSRTSMPVTFCKVIFSKNDPTTKVPCKPLSFQWYLHLSNVHLPNVRHINLIRTQIRMVTSCASESMKALKSNESIICYHSTRNENTLRGRNHTIQKRMQSVHQALGNNFKLTRIHFFFFGITTIAVSFTHFGICPNTKNCLSA